MTSISPDTNALEAFFAIQESAGRGQVGDRWLVDYVLRRLVLEGVDLATVSAGEVAISEPAARPERHPTAVVMAGGKGERLQPLTFKVPKPMLTVGRTTVLERLLEGLFAANVTDVWISVNYMADMIEDRIGDGEGRGLRVQYLYDGDQFLDRAGPLSMLPEGIEGPILMVNADQITSLNFARMIDYHEAEQAMITVGAFSHEVQVPYGVLNTEGNRLVSWDEKPSIAFSCNAGFYVLQPEVLQLIPKGVPFSTTELLAEAMARGLKVVVFPLLEKWIDIGSPEDLQQALMMFATGEEV